MTWVLTLGGLGWVKPAPGTWGSLVALVIGAFVIQFTGSFGLTVAIGVVAALAFAALPAYLDTRATADPQEVIVDEVLGQWIALLPIAIGVAHSGASVWALWPGLVTAFLAFRLFDIWKPGPISWAERLPGAWGVIADDALAGVAAALVVMLGAWVSHGLLGL